VNVLGQLDHYQRRHRWLGLPLAVVYKFVDDQGGYLAALITYYGFLSLFPLLLIMSTIVGFSLPDNPELQQQLIDSAIAQFPIIGDQLSSSAQPLRGSGTGLVVSILVAIYGGPRCRGGPADALTPFVEDVNLTDQRTYASFARAQRYKDAQKIDVEFHASAGSTRDR
jgi:hypothetical protein